MAWLRENARALRALFALTVSAALAGLLVSVEHSHSKQQADIVRKINVMLWSISELNYVSQRVVISLHDQVHDPAQAYETQVRFDVLWSRLGVVRLERFSEGAGFHELIGEFRDYMPVADEIVYFDGPQDGAQLMAVADEITGFNVRLRQLWLENFGTRKPAQKILADISADASKRSTETVVALLLGLVFLYVVFEVYQAGRDQQIERALRLEASRASAAKSRFLANVSHEIRTPLNGILGMASELEETKLDANQRKCVTVINNSGAVLLDTINDVLDLSKVEAGRMDLKDSNFNLTKTLQSAYDLYAPKAREKGLTFTLDISGQVPNSVRADERKLQQVLHNLIANAVKFTEGGRVNIVATWNTEADSITVKVLDTGVGIPSEALNKIFEPFVQADSSVTRKFGGTGLGLAISRQIIEAMGGSLTVESTLGRGSEFRILLPLRVHSNAVPTREEKKPTDVVPLHGKRVLITDDNATNRLILERFLSPSDCIVYSASGGEEAVTLASDTEFDLILMDIQMPGVDGIEATRRIRAEESETGRARVPIFAVTANVMSHQVAEYIEAGIDRVLPKPLPKKRLMEELSQITQSES
ncbi:Sensory/regulatory protein RpfC [Pelagimonas phthalicica]|uniref:histidine kinase n=1 Tax=Pelagimonas phthalicica TaxID=1037362 RepID=A0A238JHM9_9RHOB|nr:ATP-binding protein [Pelagimonas phthalicica]TDS89111.1 signal transduction histidine kinase [Pelagimonas phthalicica]SMX29714.1 Sensory/regulatory protein RpfC [Pelagimonas phthalicica]